MTLDLTDSERRQLLTIAREAIAHYVREGILPQAPMDDPKLQAMHGCFVCIKINGILRGCIGNFTSDKPLYQLVREMAAAAATRDPRFYPMKPRDLDSFTIEISVLSPLEMVTSIDQIQVGTHGIYLEKNHCRGVLLPQVAVEFGWDRDTFLDQTCIKAGLKPHDWKEGANIYTFSAQVFC